MPRLLTSNDISELENKRAIGRGEYRKALAEEPWLDPSSGWCDACRRMPCDCKPTPKPEEK